MDNLLPFTFNPLPQNGIPVPQPMISNNQRRHCLNNNNCAWNHTRIMATFAGYFGSITFAINCGLTLHDGSHRFKGYFEFNRHTIADTALYAARKIGQRLNLISSSLSFGEGRGEKRI